MILATNDNLYFTRNGSVKKGIDLIKNKINCNGGMLRPNVTHADDDYDDE